MTRSDALPQDCSWRLAAQWGPPAAATAPSTVSDGVIAYGPGRCTQPLTITSPLFIGGGVDAISAN